MKKRNELIIIYIGYITKLVSSLMFKYFKYSNYLFPKTKVTNVVLFNREAYLSKTIGCIIILAFYILSLLYIFFIRCKYLENDLIFLKKDTFYLILLLLFDYTLYMFNIKIMIYESNALKFVIVCLLTNLIVYIKYKKNNIKIK